MFLFKAQVVPFEDIKISHLRQKLYLFENNNCILLINDIVPPLRQKLYLFEKNKCTL